MHFLRPLAVVFAIAAIALSACSKAEPVSTVDPLPMPEGMDSNKDLSVKPGDSFYDYCNGSWMKNTPIPASGSSGGLYEQMDVMKQLVEQLTAENADLRRIDQLRNAASGQPQATKTFLDAQKARFPRPKTKEEFYITMGKMLADGFHLWGHPILPAWNLVYKEGRLMGTINPPMELIPSMPDPPTETDPGKYVPLSATKAGEADSPTSLIIKGLGQDPALFVTDPTMNIWWENLQGKSLEELLEIYDNAWEYYEKLGAEQLSDNERNNAAFAFSYTLSYHFIQKYFPPSAKEKYLNIIREIQASLRKRIERVEWMSQATRDNAIEKLDYCGLYVGYPDQWYEDCLVDMTGCATLAEAVYRGNRCNALLKGHLIGGKDAFSILILSASLGATGYVPNDLSLINSFYSPAYNSVFIYPGVLLPPFMPEKVSQAYEYALFTIIGHELTHGFDSNNGSKYDKWGNKRNWWTVADQMSFEERRDILANCYSHLEIDPERAPGVFSDGLATQGEDIADLGGFLTALDAYKAHLEADGYSGETLREQLRKFYESYADMWKTVYSDTKLATFPKKDEHSHARLRVNGVVMNTDLWYDLYDVDRNNVLYLPPERRAVIW